MPHVSDESILQRLVGQKPRFPAEFRLGNTLTDPTVVKFIFHRPDDVEPTVWTYGGEGDIIVLSTTGKYHTDLSLDVDGSWTWRWESIGAVESAEQGSFYVNAENSLG